MKKIAIIGAGISGLAAARQLTPHAHVTVFDKAKSVGGRLATRYSDSFEFDHGAPYFTAKTPVFQDLIYQLQHQGIVERWDARFVEIEQYKINLTRQWNEEHAHYVGSPRMNVIGKYLARDLSIMLEQPITKLIRNGSYWQLQRQDNELTDSFDWVIMALPAKQTQALLPQETHLLNPVSNVFMTGCFSMMLGLEKALPLFWDAALVKQSSISWISVNHSKPNRAPNPTMVVLSSNRWAEEHMEKDSDWVKNSMIEEMSRMVDLSSIQIKYQDLQRWRYANCTKSTLETPLIDLEHQLGLCGDWTEQGRVESAYLSGLKIADAIFERL